MIITIDGPMASGKSTVGRKLAKKLNTYYLNTGMLYRALAYLLIHEKGYKQEQLENPLIHDVDTVLDPKRFAYDYEDGFKEKIIFDRQEITPFLKTSFIDTAASLIAANCEVRKKIQHVEQELAKKYDLVVDGRDSGSFVFPNADFKFFLTATVPVRAERWQKFQQKKGNIFTLQEAIEKVNSRDQRDRKRKTAPLVIAKNAILINNSDLDIDQTVDKMMKIIKQK